MRRDNKINPAQAKHLARSKYAERQIENGGSGVGIIRNRIKYKELVEQQDKYKIKVYG